MDRLGDLRSIVDHFPRSRWQCAVDDALTIQCVIDDFNLLNRDVYLRNFVVCKSVTNGDVGIASASVPQAFMIDFVLCRLRGSEEMDAHWGRSKWNEDEEGAIELMMRKYLLNYNFELDFTHSLRFIEWAEKE